MNEYRAYAYDGSRLLIERYLLIEETPRTGFDPFDQRLPARAEEVSARLERGDIEDLEPFEDVLREGFNGFVYRPGQESKRYLLITAIDCEREITAVMNVTSAYGGKVWFNGEYLAAFTDVFGPQYYFTAAMKKGRNLLVIEQCEAGKFTVQMNRPIEQELDERDFESLVHLHGKFELDPLILLTDSLFVKDRPFRMLFLKHANRTFLPRFELQIKNTECVHFYKRVGTIGRTLSIDPAPLRREYPGRLWHRWLRCRFTRTDGSRYEFGPCLYLEDFAEEYDQIGRRLYALGRSLAAEDAAHIIGRLKYESRLSAEDSMRYWMAREDAELLDRVEKNGYPHNDHRREGTHEVFIRSRLDERYVRIAVRVPRGYTPANAYPLILSLNTTNDGWVSQWPNDDEAVRDCLIVDVSGRGFTAGSYIGEASTREILSWVLDNYRVDRNRIYLMGKSNGGFAVWAFAINQPHLAAAAFPHTGYVDIKSVENVSNLPVYQIVSPQDFVYAGREKEIERRLKPYGNYHCWYMDQMLHHHMTDYMFHERVLADMLGKVRNPYPDEIRYRTVRNRHRESYWIRLHGIARGCRSAEVHARIVDDRRVETEAHGTYGITVTIPPRIDRSRFVVAVNGQEFPLVDYRKRALIFRFRNRRWEMADAEPAVCICKGTGLLDVYMERMRIVLSDRADDALRELAARFAKPWTNGMEPDVHVQYPVYAMEDLPDNLFDNGLILPDVAGTHPLVKRLLPFLPVRPDAEGFQYGGERVEGRYVAMQVVPSPYHPGRSVLAVSTNDASLLRRHILLRKIILPTYVNGLHEYWNNQILIYTGDRYWYAYENGDPLTRID